MPAAPTPPQQDAPRYSKEDQERNDALKDMTDSQYYCERCDQVFEYRSADQHGCEQCNLTIQDNNIAELPPGARA